MTANPTSRASCLARRLTPLTSALLLTLSAGAAAMDAPDAPLGLFVERVSKSAEVARHPKSDLGEAAYYTVVFRQPPVTTYSGGVPGLAATAGPLRGAGKPRFDTPDALAYISHLEVQQERFHREMEQTFARSVDVTARMQHALNGMIAVLTEDEAAALASHPEVLVVERETMLELHTDVGPTWIGAPEIWQGNTGSGLGTRGEGIVVGIIDSGINWQSPAFAAVSPGDGYVHQNPRGAGQFLGLCVPPFADAGRCNDKLIGMYNFTSTAADRSGVDTDSHGSHVASTVAGNPWTATFGNGPFAVSGVAPRANIISYKACAPGCPSTATAQSVDQAVIDGVDVINYSISGGTSPWTEPTAIAFRNAAAAGIFVAASAGNTRPETPDPQGQVNHLSPWVQTVAASTHDRLIAMRLDLTSESNPPTNTQAIPIRPGASPLASTNLIDVPVIKSPSFGDGPNDGCTAYPANTFTRETGAVTIFRNGFEDGETNPGGPARVGAVAVINLPGGNSNCASGTRRNNALAAGAIGTIFVDTDYINLGASGTTWAMRRADWDAVEAASDPATARISIDVVSQAFPRAADVVAGFSLRGPRALGDQFLVKPDITAPGVDILASGAANVVGPNGVTVLSGTSMSSPHIAGSAALMRALNPTWTPAQIKSALSLTANTSGITNQDGSPIRPWDTGTGRANLVSASRAGLIMDETNANYIAANPAAGGDLSTLNLPNMARFNAVGDVSFTRSFRRARTGTATYTLSVEGFPPGSVQFTPSQFTVSSTGSASVNITVQSGQLTADEWTMGRVILTPSNVDEPVLSLPMTIFPAGPSLSVAPTSISAAVEVDTQQTVQVAVSNLGNPTLNWSISPGVAPVTFIDQGPQLGNGFRGSEHASSQTNTGYAADDFDLLADGTVTYLQSNGFVLPGGATLANATAIRFRIYADNDGVPAGAPRNDGTNVGAAPVWQASVVPGSPGLNIATGGAIGNISLDLVAAGLTPPSLSAGKYWMVVTPTLPGSGAGSGANSLWAAAIVGVGAPVNGLAPRSRNSTASATWGIPTLTGAPGPGPASGFSMVSRGTLECGAPWFSANPASGSLGLGGSTNVTVTLDATGLAPGTYSAPLCVVSNAGTRVIPVTMTVPSNNFNPSVAKSFSPLEVPTVSSSRLTITLSNETAQTLTTTADLVDSFPAGLVVANTPNAATTCGNGTVLAMAGEGSVTLETGAQIPPTGSCTVSVDVRSATVGTYENVIPAGALTTTPNAGSNQAPASATLSVRETVFPEPYCSVAFPLGVEPITLVQIGSIDNATTNALGGPALENFTALSTTVTPGSAPLIRVKGNTDGDFTNQVRVFIDWNNDGLFTGADEAYTIGTFANSTGLDAIEVSAPIAVPADAAPGPRRMRVIKQFSAVTGPCNTSGYGQAEDYTIIVGE